MKKNTGDFKTDLEQLLQEGNIIRLKPQGFSMYPLFIPGRDEIKMMNTYKKPVVTVDAGMAEGVYAASGAAQGTLNVTYYGVWDRWGTNGGKGLAMADWSDLNGTITLNITFMIL